VSVAQVLVVGVPEIVYQLIIPDSLSIIITGVYGGIMACEGIWK